MRRKHVQSNIQRKFPGAEISRRFTFTEPELLTFRKHKCVIQKKHNGLKKFNNSHNDHDEIELYQGTGEWNTKWHSTPEQRTPKNSTINCDGVQRPMHNVSCIISILHGWQGADYSYLTVDVRKNKKMSLCGTTWYFITYRISWSQR